MRFLRNVVVLLSGALVVVYVAALIVLYVYQRDLLFPRGEMVAELQSRTSIYRMHQIREADGTRLTIWHAPVARRGIGTFVLFYGNASSVLEFAEAGEMLHDDGFGVVLASYRGYSGNTGSPTESGLMADARAILATLHKGDGPVILWGHSLGSGVAARMAAEGRASALVLESPFTAAVDVAAAAYPIFPVRWLMKDRFDTLSLVPQIKTPVLILHGTADEVAPFEMGKMLERAFGSRATLDPLSGAHHNLDQTVLVPIVTRWLHAHSTAIYGPGTRMSRR